MNANKDAQTLLSLHRNYTYCLKQKIDDFLKADKVDNVEPEFCAAEKAAYFEHMRVHQPAEFHNIMRMEEHNF